MTARFQQSPYSWPLAKLSGTATRLASRPSPGPQKDSWTESGGAGSTLPLLLTTSAAFRLGGGCLKPLGGWKPEPPCCPCCAQPGLRCGSAHREGPAPAAMPPWAFSDGGLLAAARAALAEGEFPFGMPAAAAAPSAGPSSSKSSGSQSAAIPPSPQGTGRCPVTNDGPCAPAPAPALAPAAAATRACGRKPSGLLSALGAGAHLLLAGLAACGSTAAGSSSRLSSKLAHLLPCCTSGPLLCCAAGKAAGG
jgi:hypothetical protein